jgi:hypothetical protein
MARAMARPFEVPLPAALFPADLRSTSVPKQFNHIRLLLPATTLLTTYLLSYTG